MSTLTEPNELLFSTAVDFAIEYIGGVVGEQDAVKASCRFDLQT